MLTVQPAFYKDVIAVRIENERYAVTVLPTEGAKTASFVTKSDSREYLWQNPAPKYAHVGLEDSFVDGECSSFDDMFPTIDPIVMDSGSRAGKLYRDHGQVCRVPFTCTLADGGVVFCAELSELCCRFTKTVRESDGGEIVFDYRIENTANDGFRCLWAGHCMINVCDGGRVLTAFEPGAQAEIMFDNRLEFGKAGDTVEICDAMLTSRERHAETNSYKYYFTEPTKEGFLGYRYADGKRFMMRFDPAALPYVGVWMNDGFFKNCRCVGLEPCTAAYDTVFNAEKHGTSFTVPAGGAFNFSLSLSVDEN